MVWPTGARPTAGSGPCSAEAARKCLATQAGGQARPHGRARLALGLGALARWRGPRPASILLREQASRAGVMLLRWSCAGAVSFQTTEASTCAGPHAAAGAVLDRAQTDRPNQVGDAGVAASPGVAGTANTERRRSGRHGVGPAPPQERGRMAGKPEAASLPAAQPAAGAPSATAAPASTPARPATLSIVSHPVVPSQPATPADASSSVAASPAAEQPKVRGAKLSSCPCWAAHTRRRPTSHASAHAHWLQEKPSPPPAIKAGWASVVLASKGGKKAEQQHEPAQPASARAGAAAQEDKAQHEDNKASATEPQPAADAATAAEPPAAPVAPKVRLRPGTHHLRKATGAQHSAACRIMVRRSLPSPSSLPGPRRQATRFDGPRNAVTRHAALSCSRGRGGATCCTARRWR